MTRGPCRFGKGKGGYHHRVGKILPAGIHIAAFEFTLVRKGKRMNDEINR